MSYSNQVVEAVYVPGSNDYGFFNIFINMAHKLLYGLELEPSNDDRKSVVAKENDLWICQFCYVHNKLFNISDKEEIVLHLNMRNGAIRIEEKRVPKTDIFINASEELWIYLANKMNNPNVNMLMPRVADMVYYQSDGMYHYDYEQEDVYDNDGWLLCLNDTLLSLRGKMEFKFFN